MGQAEIRRVLAVGAHPDDIEISCAGTLARYAKKGIHVTILTVMNGDKGSYDRPAEELAREREQECLAAAAVIGAEWKGLEYVDGTLVWGPELHERMIRAIQSADPDLIITHTPNDYTSDHTETAKAVMNASFYTVCPQFRADDGKPCDTVAPVFFMDTICGVGFEPREYVDITETLEAKLEMYAKHKSQHEYLSAREGTDFSEVIKTSARYRGLQSGVQYAEAFARYDVWPRIGCERLLP